MRGTNRSGFFPTEVVQEVNIRQKNITNVSTEHRSTFQKRQDPPQQPPQQQNSLDSFCVSQKFEEMRKKPEISLKTKKYRI